MVQVNPRAIVLVLFLLLILYTPEPPQPHTKSQQDRLRQIVEHERAALNLLNTTVYGDLDVAADKWLDGLLGFKKEHGFAWVSLPQVIEKVKEQAAHVLGEQRYVSKLEGTAQSNRELLQQIVEGQRLEAGATPVPTFQNLTGWVRGEWARSRLDEHVGRPLIDLSELVPEKTYSFQSYTRNITGSTGTVQFELSQRKSSIATLENGSSARSIRAGMTIKDEGPFGASYSLNLYGVHFQEFGGVLLTTTSEKYDGIFALPHMAPSGHNFALAQALLNQTIGTEIEKQEKNVDPTRHPWTSAPFLDGEPVNPQCEYVVYLQQHPVEFGSYDNSLEGQDLATMLLAENELRFPTGALFPTLPQLKISMTVFSPDCGFVLESKGPPDYAAQESNHLQGSKVEMFESTVKSHAIVFAIVLFAQVLLQIRQMKKASTPSTRSKISFYTIAMMNLGDGFYLASFLAFSIILNSLFLALSAAAFFALCNVNILGMNFLMEIFTAQAPERRIASRRRVARAAEAENQRVAAAPVVSPRANTPIRSQEDVGLPLPAIAARSVSSGATPIMLPPDQDLETAAADDANVTTAASNNDEEQNPRRQFQAIYTRFYLILFAIGFSTTLVASWPTPIRSAYVNTLVFAYLSFWWPQIYRNVMRNCRKALLWEYVLGQSLCRLSPFVYVYTVGGSFLSIARDGKFAFAMLCWIWLQLCVLVSQELVGPRFLIKSSWSWVPEAYDYHPIIREDEEGGLVPLGLRREASSSSSSSEGGDGSPVSTRRGSDARESTTGADGKGNKRVFDCAICTEGIEVSVVGTADDGGSMGAASNVLDRRKYMVTPCRHIFHTQCLEDWMKYRLVCPNCRETLPPM